MQKNLWDGVRVTPQLVRDWSGKMFDVCGVGEQKEREIFITHTHRDHLPLHLLVIPKTKIYIASPLLPRIQRIYPQATIEEYSDYFATGHTLIINGRVTRVESFGYFIKDLLVVPESDDAAQLIKEYKPRVVFTFAFKQPRSHFGNPFNNNRRDVFILDNTAWKPYRPNIIPKRIFAESDRELYQKRMIQQRKFFAIAP